MKRANEKQERLKKILWAAYDGKETPQAGPQWKADTMNRIRRSALESSPAGFTQMFEQFVWRLTPVAGAVALIIFIVLLQFNFIPDTAVFQLLMNETEEYSLLQQLVL